MKKPLPPVWLFLLPNNPGIFEVPVIRPEYELPGLGGGAQNKALDLGSHPWN